MSSIYIAQGPYSGIRSFEISSTYVLHGHAYGYVTRTVNAAPKSLEDMIADAKSLSYRIREAFHSDR